MAISKIIFNGETLMDVTQDTVTTEALLSSYTATKNDGTKISGTFNVPPTTDIEDAIINRTISGAYKNSGAQRLHAEALRNCSQLTEISFSACLRIGDSVFYNCTNLTTASFPACSYIGGTAFAFCSELTNIDFPNCETIQGGAFSSCTKLTSINFPKCITIGPMAFARCSNLSFINFPSCTSIYSMAFDDCSSLTYVYFPKCTYISGLAFEGCTNLSVISFPACETLSQAIFRSCYVLLSAYFLGSSVPTAPYSNIFISTPISGYTTYTDGVLGSIFVKESMLTAFQTATNWSPYSERMVGLTDAEIEALTI